MSTATVDTLAGQLHRSLADLGQTHCYVLTGPGALGAFSADELASCRQNDIEVRSVRISHPYLDASYWPHLIRLCPERSRDAALMRRAIAMAVQDCQPDALAAGRGHRIAAVLLGDVKPAVLARHLARVVLQNKPGGGKRLLSMLDPAAFEHIWRVCRNDQRQQLLGPIREWHTIDRWLTWAIQPRPGEAPGSTTHAALALTDEQWQALADVRALNRVWARAVNAENVVSRQRFDQLPTALKQARRYGITDARDLETFAWHALTVCPDFDRHALIQACLHARAPGDTYSLAVADLSDDDWTAIRRGTPTETAYTMKGNA